MKEQIRISTKYAPLLFFLFSISVVIAFLSFGKKYLSHKKELEVLMTKQINGRINLLNNKSRGSLDLKIGGCTINSLPIAYEINKFDIQIGDSVSKCPDSRMMVFYKDNNGVFEKCFEYEIIP